MAPHEIYRNDRLFSCLTLSHHSDSQNGYQKKDKKQVAKMQRKGEPFHCGWEYKAVQPQ